MTTDDERPSGTGLRGAIEALAEEWERIAGEATKGIRAAAEASEHKSPRFPAWIGALRKRATEVRALLAAHPDAAAGTTVEEWGVRCDDSECHNCGFRKGPIVTEDEQEARDIAAAGNRIVVFRRTRTTYADTVTEWEEVDD